jgi:hypothetical protein
MANPIAIECPECHKEMKAPAELQGKRIKCKGCGHAFVVKAAAAPAAAVKKPVDDEDEGPAGPYEFKQIQLKPRCPECAKELPSEDTAVCINCGYNMRTRTRVQTKKTVNITSADRFMWQLPGYLCILFIVVLVILDLLYWRWEPTKDELARSYWAWLSYGGFKVWGIVASLFVIAGLGTFAFKRLILNNEPPEIEVH